MNSNTVASLDAGLCGTLRACICVKRNSLGANGCVPDSSRFPEKHGNNTKGGKKRHWEKIKRIVRMLDNDFTTLSISATCEDLHTAPAAEGSAVLHRPSPGGRAGGGFGWELENRHPRVPRRGGGVLRLQSEGRWDAGIRLQRLESLWSDVLMDFVVDTENPKVGFNLHKQPGRRKSKASPERLW